MTNAEFSKWKSYILAEQTEDDLFENIKAGAYPKDSFYLAIKRYVENGNFECYYDDVEGVLKDIYGDTFDASRYHNKDGSWKFIGNDYKVGKVYEAKMVLALEKIFKDKALSW